MLSIIPSKSLVCAGTFSWHQAYELAYQLPSSKPVPLPLVAFQLACLALAGTRRQSSEVALAFSLVAAVAGTCLNTLSSYSLEDSSQ